ncbi:MAG TPA: hypothetical protein VGE75_02155 [Acidimicrobiales bacterium]
MNSTELSLALAEPIQLLGMSFYFTPTTTERAKTHGLNVYEFYGLGRGGVLGDVDFDAVFEAFTFFSASAMDMLWSKSREKADPKTVANDHVLAAFAFADETFGAVPSAVLEGFAKAAFKVANAVPTGQHALFDGYKHFDAPSDPVHAAYLGAILLRELRGGVHIHAVNEVGITPAQAAYLQAPFIFKLHGYGEDEVPEVTSELESKKQRAEELTTLGEAAYFDVLGNDERQALYDGAMAMRDALQRPVAVTV